MRHAPPVSLRCSGGVFWRVLQTALYTAAAAAFSAWWLQRWGWPLVWWLLPASKAAVLAWVLARPRAVQLQWDGAAWSVNGAAGQVAVAWDLGFFLLLRWRGDTPARTRWLPVTAAEAGPNWHGLRVAAFSHRGVAPAEPTAAP